MNKIETADRSATFIRIIALSHRLCRVLEVILESVRMRSNIFRRFLLPQIYLFVAKK